MIVMRYLSDDRALDSQTCSKRYTTKIYIVKNEKKNISVSASLCSAGKHKYHAQENIKDKTCAVSPPYICYEKESSDILEPL